MHGAAITMSKNIRRVGVPATKRGRVNPTYAEASGPTLERLAKAVGHVSVGDDKQGTRVYHFHDSAIDRLYSRLAKQAKSRVAEELIRSEYTALQRYRHHWHNAGLEPSIGSVDLNRIFASDPSSMSGMAKTERQAHHRKQFRDARALLGWKPHIIVENVLFADNPLDIAGWSVGLGPSRTSARDGAERVVRESARKLAKLWGIS